MSHLPCSEADVLHFFGAVTNYRMAYLYWLQAGPIDIILPVKFRWLPLLPLQLLQLEGCRTELQRRRWAEKVCPGWWMWRQKEREDTSPVSNQRSCGARFKAGMGQISKVLEFCHPLFPPPTFPRKKGGGETKKSEVVKKEEVGRVGRKGRKESQTHGRVWSGEEQREARHCFFFYACASLCLLHQDSYFASFTSQFVESLTDCPVFPPKICLTCGCIVCLCDITMGTDISRHPTNVLAPPTGT